jgi:hypothetical protein
MAAVDRLAVVLGEAVEDLVCVSAVEEQHTAEQRPPVRPVRVVPHGGPQAPLGDRGVVEQEPAGEVPQLPVDAGGRGPVRVDNLRARGDDPWWGRVGPHR